MVLFKISHKIMRLRFFSLFFLPLLISPLFAAHGQEAKPAKKMEDVMGNVPSIPNEKLRPLPELFLLSPEEVNEELIYRALFGQVADVRLLLQSGADPNIKNEKGWPVLSIAIYRSDAEALPIVQALLNAGANITAFDPHGELPLTRAILLKNTDIAKILLNYGATLYQRNRDGRTAWELAYSTPDFEVAEHMDHLLRAHMLAERMAQSPELLNETMRRFAFQVCAVQYTVYYLDSRMPKPEKEKWEHYLKAQEKSLGQTLQDLGKFDGFSSELAQLVTDETQKQIFANLDDYYNDRLRRQAGVGTEGDLLKRCLSVANGWSAVY